MINYTIPYFSNLIIDTWDKFDKVFLEILNKHAPLKRKLLKANHGMQKAVMKRSSLEKKSLKKNQQIFKNLQKANKKLL